MYNSHAAVNAHQRRRGESVSPSVTGALAAAGLVGQVVDDVASLVREVATAVLRSYRYRKTVRELSRLDDRALQDIGLDRSEIEVTAYSLAERSLSARPRYLPALGAKQRC